jgi:hypothetical protein
MPAAGGRSTCTSVETPIERGFDMTLTRMRLAGLAAALTTIAIAAPVSTAGAAAAAPARQPATLVGPTYITTAPATFINNNNQVSASATSAGAQIAP